MPCGMLWFGLVLVLVLVLVRPTSQEGAGWMTGRWAMRGGGTSCGAHTHFLSWPPLISSMLSWERRSGSIVAGVYVAAALGILSLVGGGRREFCDIVGELGSRDGCAGRGSTALGWPFF